MNKRPFIYIFTTLILLTLWTLMIWLPSYRQNLLIKVRINEAKQQLNDYKYTLEQLPLIIAEKKQYENMKSILDEKLYTKQDILKLFDKLYDIAYKEQLHIVEITPPVEELLMLNRNISDSTQPLFLNITLSMTGNYINFGKFSEKIENSQFHRKTNICQIIGDSKPVNKLKFMFGFKALLGKLDNKS